MKRKILLALCLAPAMAWAQDGNFILKAKIGNVASPAKAYLNYRAAGKVVTDSSSVQNGEFQFKGSVAEPTRAQLVLDHQGVGLSKLGRNADVVLLYLEKGTISLAAKDSVKKAEISGSKLNEDEKRYKAMVAGPENAMAMVNEDYKAASEEQKKDQGFMDGLQARYNKAQEERKAIQQQFIKQNPNSYLSLLALVDMAGMDIDVPVVEPLFKSLSPVVTGNSAGQNFAKSIEASRATSVGAMAPVFTQNDVNDKPVSLADFKGKYVLLDFWASWCGPCRAENPNVLKAYHQYKDKNFTVLGVSLDRPGKKEDWLAAIKADGLEWTQVSDLKFWDNSAAKMYGIRAIPQNYLIDPTGKIIAKNLRGEALNQKLASLLK
ncbi:AhpC/TSA family protein [Mucilaginibacter sp. RS28]|uniref:AhpC/TSA family protein n=1 Tax=Mucilaginibacter straminoryzae TaxID=2932774 RepID=A0A9X2B7Q2_9SPHI|nr:TlpA disulfide reductase family protein [Mucilaginibacter straminoryzae]MCJ8208829.1 AhpC/TSA family protein [Mucilaginibacter straminoryzae]